MPKGGRSIAGLGSKTCQDCRRLIAALGSVSPAPFPHSTPSPCTFSVCVFCRKLDLVILHVRRIPRSSKRGHIGLSALFDLVLFFDIFVMLLRFMLLSCGWVCGAYFIMAF